MPDLIHDSTADRAYCPGCGASLKLEAEQALMTCQFCGSECKVVRRLRRLEPSLPDGPPPKPPVDPDRDYKRWGAEALVWGILNGSDLTGQIAMANALDSWPHAHSKAMPDQVARYVAYMLTAPAELDKAMRGILGKLICEGDPRRRNIVIRAGQRYGFTQPGSHGLLFALSLGDAGTVKLLLEIAEWAQEKGHAEYCNAALMGVQTAIGRERNYRHVCNQILLHRLPYVSGQVREWILKHTLLEFDVGYIQHRPWVLELIDDMSTEQPDLIEPVQATLQKCGGAKDEDEWQARIYGANQLRSKPAKLAALKSMGEAPYKMDPDKSQLAVDQLEHFLDDNETREPAAVIFKGLLWLGDGVPDPLAALHDRRGDAMPKVFTDSFKSRSGQR